MLGVALCRRGISTELSRVFSRSANSVGSSAGRRGRRRELRRADRRRPRLGRPCRGDVGDSAPAAVPAGRHRRPSPVRCRHRPPPRPGRRPRRHWRSRFARRHRGRAARPCFPRRRTPDHQADVRPAHCYRSPVGRRQPEQRGRRDVVHRLPPGTGPPRPAEPARPARTHPQTAHAPSASRGCTCSATATGPARPLPPLSASAAPPATPPARSPVCSRRRLSGRRAVTTLFTQLRTAPSCQWYQRQFLRTVPWGRGMRTHADRRLFPRQAR